MSEFYDSAKTQAYAELHIWGKYILPKEITVLLGLPPTSSNEVGELWKLNGKPRVVASWTLGTEKKALIQDASETLDDLISILKDKVEIIKSIRNRYEDCIIVVHVVVENQQNFLPGFSLEPEHIKFLADIGTGIEFDIYHNPEN